MINRIRNRARFLLGITMLGLAIPFSYEAWAAECSNIQGHASAYSRGTATSRAQSIVDRQLVRLGRGGVFGRRVQCAEGRRRYRTYYSCTVQVRFCSLAGVRPKTRVFR